jgi:hypothetical protein
MELNMIMADFYPLKYGKTTPLLLIFLKIKYKIIDKR